MMNNHHNHLSTKRGFTLLIAIILATVSLVVGLALADVAYKQVILSSAARHSQVAFYNADSAMECALYWDQQFAIFNASTPTSFTIQCENHDITVSRSSSGGRITSTFNVPCSSGGRSGSVTVFKQTSGECSPGKKTCIFASGFNLCDASDPNRFERGLKVRY